jgi:hypothetical protein
VTSGDEHGRPGATEVRFRSARAGRPGGPPRRGLCTFAVIRTGGPLVQSAQLTPIVAVPGHMLIVSRWVTVMGIACRYAWNGSWNGAPDNPSVAGAVSAMIRVICAASAHAARGRTSHNPSVVGSSPPAPPAVICYIRRCSRTGSWNDVGGTVYGAAMPGTPSGHIEQLPSGSWRARVYTGKDPLTGREIRFPTTCKSELDAQIELGKPLRSRRPGGSRTPVSPWLSCSTSTFRPPGGICSPGKQPRVHPPDHQTRPRVRSGRT